MVWCDSRASPNVSLDILETSSGEESLYIDDEPTPPPARGRVFLPEVHIPTMVTADESLEQFGLSAIELDGALGPRSYAVDPYEFFCSIEDAEKQRMIAQQRQFQ